MTNKLQQRAEAIMTETQKDEFYSKLHDQRERDISEAKQFQKTIFWCSICHEDFETMGIKIVQRGWRIPIAFYEAKCRSCDKYCRRRITDKHADPYWYDSELMKVQRKMHRNDLLQPGDPGFDILYPQHKRKMLEQENAYERQQYARSR